MQVEAFCCLNTFITIALVELSDLLDLQHVNSSTSPEIHKSKWLVNWGKNKVTLKVTYTISDMNKTCLIIIERIIIATSFDISVYFTNSKCIVFLVLM